jgi:hypothetical protein
MSWMRNFQSLGIDCLGENLCAHRCAQCIWGNEIDMPAQNGFQQTLQPDKFKQTDRLAKFYQTINITVGVASLRATEPKSAAFATWCSASWSA